MLFRLEVFWGCLCWSGWRSASDLHAGQIRGLLGGWFLSYIWNLPWIHPGQVWDPPDVPEFSVLVTFNVALGALLWSGWESPGTLYDGQL